MSPATVTSTLLSNVTFERLPSLLSEVKLESLKQIATETFVITFGANYTPEDLNSYLNERLSLTALREEALDTNNTFYLVYCNDALAGYIKWTVPSQRYLDSEQPWQNALFLERFYFLPAYQGLGLADLAMQLVLNAAKRIYKADMIYLSVWEHNPKAQRFYARYGFKQFGTMGYKVGETIDNEWLLGRKP